MHDITNRVVHDVAGDYMMSGGVHLKKFVSNLEIVTISVSKVKRVIPYSNIRSWSYCF